MDNIPTLLVITVKISVKMRRETAQCASLAALVGLLQPHPPQEMEAYEVSSLVNSPKNNLPECMERVGQMTDEGGSASAP